MYVPIFRTVSSWPLLSPLHNWCKLVHGQFGQSNIERTLDFCPISARKDSNVPQLNG